MTDAKRNLERWLFYFDRFNNHELSAKLDRERLEQSAERITEVQNETGMSWIEVCAVHITEMGGGADREVGTLHAASGRGALALPTNAEVVVHHGVLPRGG
jgi:hypothetical protein